jgi:hypothetical protein
MIDERSGPSARRMNAVRATHSITQRRVTLVLLFTAVLVPVGGPMKAAETAPGGAPSVTIEHPGR